MNIQAEDVLRLISGRPYGLCPGEIARLLRVNQDEVTPVLRQLVLDGKLETNNRWNRTNYVICELNNAEKEFPNTVRQNVTRTP